MIEYHIIVAFILKNWRNEPLKMPTPYLGELEFYVQAPTPEEAKAIALNKLPFSVLDEHEHVRIEVECEPVEEGE